MTRSHAAFASVIVAVTCAATPLSTPAKELCSGAEATPRCLMAHRDALYASNYERFWAIANEVARRARRCDDLGRTADFLRMASERSRNAEFEEFLAREVEGLCLESAPCFKAASARLDAKARASLAHMLAAPVFQEKKALERARCLTPERRRPRPNPEEGAGRAEEAPRRGAGER
jgi:hypothetical protein